MVSHVVSPPHDSACRPAGWEPEGEPKLPVNYPSFCLATRGRVVERWVCTGNKGAGLLAP